VTKSELVGILAKASGGSRASAERALHTFMDEIVEALRRGRSVTISGFGTFVVSRRAARPGRHPRTGAKMALPAAKVARFRPSRALKTAVR
jgi:DNA-binding protein HU-beta